MLTTDELIQLLESPKDRRRSLTPYSVSPARIQRCIDDIRRRQLCLEEDKDLLALTDLVEEPLKLVQFEQRQALGECEIYVLPLPLCEAYSQRLGERKIIVIGSGLIDLLESVSYSAQIIGSLPAASQDLYPLQELPELSLSDLLNQFVFVLLFRFYHDGEPLPNLIDICSATQRHNARISFAGGLAAVLLHELGHLSLEHHNKSTQIEHGFKQGASPQSKLGDDAATSAVPEASTFSKQQEYDADQFILDSLEAAFEEIGHFFIKSAFDFFVRLETVAGQFHELHPLALNRIYHMNQQIPEHCEFHDPVESQKTYRSLGQAFQSTRRILPPEDNHLLNIKRNTALLILSAIHQPLLEQGLDIQPLLEDEAPGWRDNLREYGVPWEQPDD